MLGVDPDPNGVTAIEARRFTKKKIGGKRLQEIAAAINEYSDGGEAKKDEPKH